MSQMKSAVVLRCVRCGRPVILAHLSTTQPDVNGDELHRMMHNVAAKALCEHCQNARLYYIQENRLEDWEAGRP